MEIDTIDKLKQVSQEGFAVGYSRLLKHYVTSLKLGNHVGVSAEVTRKTGDEYAGSLNYGYLGIEEGGVASVVGARGQVRGGSRPINSIIPVPINSAPYIHTSEQGVFVSSFIALEDDVLRPVAVDRPIPLDGIDPMFSESTGFEAFPAYPKEYDKLKDTSHNKWKTREILQDTDLTPRGFRLEEVEDNAVRMAFVNFLRANKNVDGLVVKRNFGHGGYGVRMFDESWLEAAIYAQELQLEGFDVLVEERIVPPEIIFEGKRYDYNLRVLTTANSNSKVIDSEMRINKYGQDPVNVSQKAFALETEKHFTKEFVSDLHQIAEEASNVFCRYHGVPSSGIPGFLGIDIIPSQRGGAYVNEINAGNVGGLGTLSRIREQPVRAVGNYLSGLEPFLENARKSRGSRDEVQSIPLRDEDWAMLNKAHYFISKEFYINLVRYIKKAAQKAGTEPSAALVGI